MKDASVGIVAIGRNEGERLRRCLDSTCGRGRVVVYVDSGSTDGSVALARSRGAEVVELDPHVPFTASRARNEGFQRLLERAPDTDLVQFVDGDCELDSAWLERAASELDRHSELAIVCGRRRERAPDASIYNRLCDMEWDTPIGEATDCGGDGLVRVEAFREAGGFDPALIAGEEPDLCLRLRVRGWKIVRIDAEMTLHDAAMTRASQWWARAVRNGHAAAEGVTRYGAGGEHHHVRHVASFLCWSALPLASLLASALAWFAGSPKLALWLPLAALAALCVPAWRAARTRIARGDRFSHSLLYGASCLLGKLPAAMGVLRYWRDRLRGRSRGWIEYKDQPAGPGAGAAR